MKDFGIKLEDAKQQVASKVEECTQYITQEFNSNWEDAEAYYAGKCDLKSDEGRSKANKTETRDAIRGLMPEFMRVFLQSKKIVEYTPYNVLSGNFAEQQALWIRQLFLQNGGYKLLYESTLESAKLKTGPIKCFWLESPEPEYFSVTGIPAEEVIQYKEAEDIIVHEITEHESPVEGTIELFDLTATRYYENGKIEMEAFPMYEFFVERNATNLEDFVHGHARLVTVGEAIEMGLEHDNWDELDAKDPEATNAAGAANYRRGHSVNENEVDIEDKTLHKFLLSETYCKLDLNNDGVLEKYVFYFGGTNYEYLHHEQIEDFAIDLVNIDPQQQTVIGRSIFDVTKESTDINTSLLRAILDNAAIANNPRPAADPTRTNFTDLMNNAIGAPIRTKGDPNIKTYDTPFTGAGLIPVMQYIEQDAQMRVGVTKAALGLDPDALQSTDKDAVRNTIERSLGQVELMVRNVVELALLPFFKKLLRLSIRHMPRRQILRYKGAFIPVDLTTFDPNWLAEPAVGLGTANHDTKLQTLGFVLQKQEGVIAEHGLDNPIASLAQMYNTLEDMLELGGITNVGRYFSYVDKAVEAKMAEHKKQQQQAMMEAEQANKPLDPSKVLLEIETIKTKQKNITDLMSQRNKEYELLLDALVKREDLDIRRDELVKDRYVGLGAVGQEGANDAVRREQATNEKITTPRPPSAQGDPTTTGQPLIGNGLDKPI